MQLTYKDETLFVCIEEYLEKRKKEMLGKKISKITNDYDIEHIKLKINDEDIEFDTFIKSNSKNKNKHYN